MVSFSQSDHLLNALYRLGFDSKWKCLMTKEQQVVSLSITNTQRGTDSGRQCRNPMSIYFHSGPIKHNEQQEENTITEIALKQSLK